jgi:hypothetical protein
VHFGIKALEGSNLLADEWRLPEIVDPGELKNVFQGQGSGE